MTMELLNQLLDVSIRGTFLGITLFFWGCGLIAIWKWFFGAAKTFIKWLFPNSFKKKKSNSKLENM